MTSQQRQAVAETWERIRHTGEGAGGQGWPVWWDRRIPAGRTFARVIAEEIVKARCVVTLWSVESVRKEWVNEEASEGKKRGMLAPAEKERVQAIKVLLALRKAGARR